MPIYEYSCDNCEVEFEILVRGDQDQGCPDCGSSHLTRQFSVPAAHSAQSTGSMPVAGCGRPACGDGVCRGG
ncbi:MAG: FmdB family transcriptional regulator [Planctomycetaceae bacterium]|nr:FmdB family transcriptional regulator [Planctomycetaceae bacterium]